METTLATALTSIGSVVTFLMGKFGEILGYVVTEPALIIPFGIFVVGGIIGLVSRLRGAF